MVKKYPSHSAALGWYGWALFRSDRHAHAGRAAELLDRAIDLDPSDPQLHFFRGKVFAYEKNWKKAEQSFLQTLRLQANFADATASLLEARNWLKAGAPRP